jgi:hypothetical protein
MRGMAVGMEMYEELREEIKEYREIYENYWNHEDDRFEDKLSIAAMVRNEAPYLQEWIEYHKLAGVDRFYIYDNYSDDNIVEVLAPYIQDGSVVYAVFPEKESHTLEAQTGAYNDAIKKCRNKTKWLALIDIDEFIVPVQTGTITDAIEAVEKNVAGKKTAALGVYWVLYGFSDHYTKPEGLVIENYRRSRVKEMIGVGGGGLPDVYWWIKEEWVKSIVNPRMVIAYGIHGGKYILKEKGIDERGEEILEGGGVPAGRSPSIERIRINHYWTKSYEEYTKKIERQKDLDKEKYIKIDYDPRFLSEKEDYIMEKYAAKLKETMNNPRKRRGVLRLLFKTFCKTFFKIAIRCFIW